MKLFIALLIILLVPKPLSSQSKGELIPLWTYGVEYDHPVDQSRDIQTFSINVLYGWKKATKSPFTFGAGATLTRAWGSITQLDNNFNDVIFENNAFGIGPIFYLKYEPFNYRGWSLAPDFLGGILLYSDRFPAGGDIYNFMWRLGGVLSYQPHTDTAFGLTYRWMHVSNGQGVTPKNPSYEALGFGISFTKYLN